MPSKIWNFSDVPPGVELNFQSILREEMKFGLLDWTVEKPSKTTDFLDLTILIENNGAISTKTFIKPMCLHLYIPPASAHPKGVLKSLIFGNIRRYWNQCTYERDFLHVTKAFYGHLLNRGYSRQVLDDVFDEVTSKLKPRPKLQTDGEQLWEDTPTPTPRSGTFIHWEYHPRDIGRRTIRQIFEETVAPAMQDSQVSPGQLTIAYSVPRSLGQCLTKTQLEEPPGCRVSSMLEPIQ